MNTAQAIALIDAENARLGSPGFLETLEELQIRIAERTLCDGELRAAYNIVMISGRALFAPLDDTDPENVYGSATMAQSIAESRK